MQNILITGGTGMIGQALSHALLQKGYSVTILTRNTNKMPYKAPNLSYADWDVERQTINIKAISIADHIIHLAGANVMEKRWTRSRKKEIVNSRVHGCHLVVKALSQFPNRVRTVVSASAIGWYGPSPLGNISMAPFTEDHAPYNDFLGRTCEMWEEAIKPVQALRKKLVIFRTGVVLGKGEGALMEFEKYLKFGLATIPGNGKQVLSWIHVDDLVNLYIKAIEEENIQGIYNTVAPFPVTSRQLVKAIAEARNGRKFISLRAPTFLLKWILGERSIEVLKSAIVSSKKIQQGGYQFTFPTIQEAAKNIYGKKLNP